LGRAPGVALAPLHAEHGIGRNVQPPPSGEADGDWRTSVAAALAGSQVPSTLAGSMTSPPWGTHKTEAPTTPRPPQSGGGIRKAPRDPSTSREPPPVVASSHVKIRPPASGIDHTQMGILHRDVVHPPDKEWLRLIDPADKKDTELLQYFWHFLRSQMAAVKRELLEVKQGVAALEQINTVRSAWEHDMQHQMHETQEFVKSVQKGWRDEATRLSAEIHSSIIQGKELKARIADLDSSVRQELLVMGEHHARNEAATNRLQEFHDKLNEHHLSFKAETVKITSEDRRVHNLRCDTLERALGDLDVRMKTDLQSTSNEHHQHRREQGVSLQNALEAAELGLRKDMAQTSLEHRTRADEERQALRSSIDELEAALRKKMALETGERHRYFDELNTLLQTRSKELQDEINGVSTRTSEDLSHFEKENRLTCAGLRSTLHNVESEAKDLGKDLELVKSWVVDIMSIPLIHGALH